MIYNFCFHFFILFHLDQRAARWWSMWSLYFLLNNLWLKFVSNFIINITFWFFESLNVWAIVKSTENPCFLSFSKYWKVEWWIFSWIASYMRSSKTAYFFFYQIYKNFLSLSFYISDVPLFWEVTDISSIFHKTIGLSFEMVQFLLDLCASECDYLWNKSF